MTATNIRTEPATGNDDADPADTPESRARAGVATVEARIDTIVEIMGRLEWVRGKSAKRLAEQWGLSKSTVENYSAEAHRRMTADADEARRDITVGCRRVWKFAVESNDAQAMKHIGSLWADVAGALAPVQQQIMVSGPATPAQAARLVREAFGDKVISKHEEPPPPDPEPPVTDSGE